MRKRRKICPVRPVDYLAASRNRRVRMPGGTRQGSANRLKRTISGVPSVTYHLNTTFAAVVLAASLLASSNFALAADAVSSASKVPAATADAPVLEGVRTMAAKGGDKLPDNVDGLLLIPSVVSGISI